MTKFLRLSFLPALLAAVLVSCDEEEVAEVDPVVPTTIQFSESSSVVSENETRKTITLTLNKPASKNGSVLLKVFSEQADAFTTQPATEQGKLVVSFPAGSTTASFEIVPANNDIFDAFRSVSFTILETSLDLKIGATQTTVVAIHDDETLVTANFLLNIGTSRENANPAAAIEIALSRKAPANGQLVIQLASQDVTYGTDFTTTPAAINNRITVPVIVGQDHVEIILHPSNDELYNGERKITFNIIEATGGVTKGESTTHQFTITDDELLTKGKRYEVVAGNWRVNRTYQYNEDGTIAKILWEQYTPAYTGGSYTYVYHLGKLHNMIENANRETYYEWQNDRIAKEEQYTNGVLTKYTMYAYDEAGNIGEAAVHYRQPDGEFKLATLFVYLYYTTGNIYKKLVYNPIDGPEEYALSETHTYENYLALENPFPMVEILPNVNSQPNLPGIYTVETATKTLVYQLTYSLSEDGKPVSRTATSSSGTETATYQYY